MIDVTETREWLRCEMAKGGVAVGAIVGRFAMALDELEALHKPVSITDAVVEEAAIAAWCVDGESAESFRRAVGWRQDDFRREARAVLEYAATLARSALAGPTEEQAAKIQPPYDWVDYPLAPAVDPRADRLVRYRCAALTQLMQSPVDPTAYASGHALIKEVVDGAEVWAHAMLAAERSPDAE